MVHFLALRLLENTNRKPHAGSRTDRSASPYGNRKCPKRKTTKPLPALFRKHSPGGRTIDMPSSSCCWLGRIVSLTARHLVIGQVLSTVKERIMNLCMQRLKRQLASAQHVGHAVSLAGVEPLDGRSFGRVTLLWWRTDRWPGRAGRRRVYLIAV